MSLLFVILPSLRASIVFSSACCVRSLGIELDCVPSNALDTSSAIPRFALVAELSGVPNASPTVCAREAPVFSVSTVVSGASGNVTLSAGVSVLVRLSHVFCAVAFIDSHAVDAALAIVVPTVFTPSCSAVANPVPALGVGDTGTVKPD